MKQNKKLIITSIILSIIIFIIIYNVKNPVIKDLYGGREVIKYKGEQAVMNDFFPDFSEAEYLGRTEDKDFKVYAYGNDSNYNFFTLVGSDNTYSYKKENLVIPTSGNVTKVFINPSIGDNENKVIKNQKDINIFKKLISYKGEELSYHINNIYTEGAEIYFAYDNCPVTTYNNLVGYIAYIDNTWILVKPENYRSYANKGNSNKADFIGIKITDSKLIEYLNQNSTKLDLSSIH